MIEKAMAGFIGLIAAVLAAFVVEMAKTNVEQRLGGVAWLLTAICGVSTLGIAAIAVLLMVAT